MKRLTTMSLVLGALAWPSMGLAEISFTNGSWTTDFDYGQLCNMGGYGGAVDCRDIENDGTNWHYNNTGDDGGPYSEINPAAALPQGNNVNGYRQNGFPIRIGWANNEPELWVRWYMRYEAGYSWVGGGPKWHKWLYMYTGETTNKSDRWVIPEPYSGGYRIISGGFESTTSSPDWNDTFGATSDGSWHMVEVHLKMDTNGQADGSPANGIAQMWIDGVKIIDANDFNYSRGSLEARSGIRFFNIASNKSEVATGGYIDFSDIEIWKVTPPNISPDGDPWIGPVNGFSGAGSLPRPKSPAPVSISFYAPIDENNFTNRGVGYDKTSLVLSYLEATSGSTKSTGYRFNSDATQAVR